MESKRRTEVVERKEKRPRREHTSLLQLLEQVEQCTLPTGTDYHQLMELGSVTVEGRERDGEDVLKEAVNAIDQTLRAIADCASLEKYEVGASTETAISWMDTAMDCLMERIDTSLADL